MKISMESQDMNTSASIGLEGKPEGPSAPQGREPKSRPPDGIREKILRHPLPRYSGPYSVGYMDIEVPARNPRHFSEIKRNHEHLLKIETVLCAVYYPSSFGSGDGPAPDGGNKKKWSRATWLPRPRLQTAKGYAKFASLPNWPTAAFFASTSMFTKLPAFRNTGLAEHWPPTRNAREGGWKVKNEAGSPPPGERDSPTFPLLIFSHGLGGTRTTYSSVCGEFASYGFIVCALEHRDGSGPRTFVNIPQDVPNKDDDTSGDSRQTQANPQTQAQGYDVVDYAFPKDNENDTAPSNEKGVDKELRKAQIELRLAEIEEAYHVLSLICEGRGSEVAQANLRYAGRKGASSRGLNGINWERWKGRFHLKQVTMLGHSFGAATTVEILRHADRFNWVGQGILYDPWGAVIEPPEGEPRHRINAPLLCIASEAFAYWPTNYSALLQLCKEVKEHGSLCWLMTVRGSIHVSQSDFSLLYPRLCSLFLKMTVNPRRAIDININASLEFLKMVMPSRISTMNRGTNEGLLEKSIIEDLPQDYRPNEKWTAVRLRIPHEARLRVIPGFIRRPLLSYYARKHGITLPKDPNGNPLVGLQSLHEDEIWMHVAPTKEELEKKGLGPSRELETHESDGMADCASTGTQDMPNGHKEGGLEKRYMDRFE